MLSEHINTEIRPLYAGTPVPFELLLLADEELQAIEKYIYASEICIAETSGKIIGTYALYPIDSNTAEIKAIAVEEAFQNRGIGKALLEHAVRNARQKGFRELIIGTPAVAGKQLSIYRKAGFKLYDIRKDFFLIHYSRPIFEDGLLLTDMAMLRKCLL